MKEIQLTQGYDAAALRFFGKFALTNKRLERGAMTVTFSLTESHLQILRFVVLQTPTFILGQSRYDDPPEIAEGIRVSNAHTDDLTRLGFLQDVSADAPIKLADLEKEQGRKHRIFVLTRGGVEFFNQLSNPLIN